MATSRSTTPFFINDASCDGNACAAPANVLGTQPQVKQ
ncbi:uncharacterized protein G2W53_032361 [Senna tora]|uniref:Uncharacterized protein n=1 Tax=Senna tora TaxID=362788 RepID=A0A834W687_9FABA|nr:uncharacterized protein G2W53_032361 [Senna tora]